jgi:hypothetical protein
VLKVTPLGSVPDSVIPGFGNPDAITVNDPAAPTVKVVLVPLVIAGAWSTVSVKFCVIVAALFFAVNVMV